MGELGVDEKTDLISSLITKKGEDVDWIHMGQAGCSWPCIETCDLAEKFLTSFSRRTLQYARSKTHLIFYVKYEYTVVF